MVDLTEGRSRTEHFFEKKNCSKTGDTIRNYKLVNLHYLHKHHTKY